MSIPPKVEITGQDKEANFVSEFHIMHTPNEFLLTLLEVIPQMKFEVQDIIHPKTQKPSKITRMTNDGILQKVVGRYGMSPASYKKMVQIMNQNLMNYEKKFGEIMIQPPEFMH